jgi:cyclophilin family peptidyl-prolyl cis-trans isomerase
MRAQNLTTVSAAVTAFLAIVNVRAAEVAICTDAGRIVIDLNEAAAPLQVENFLYYVERGHYTGTVFHRVIDEFMIQGGGYDRNLELRAAARTVENESRNGLKNSRGTVAAARTGDPHSAAAQFFINTVDNEYLNASASEWGYTVFGQVTEGMDVVDSIGTLPTGRSGAFRSDVPDPLVTILSISVLDTDALTEADGPDRQAALLARIDAAEEMNAPAEALEWITHYRAICAPAGPDLLVTEARNAAAVDANVRARFALEEFFATTPETHSDYSEAASLYERVADSTTGAIDVNVCTEPGAPNVPDGTRESLEVMLAAQSAVQEFMQAGSDYLDCMDELIENQATPPEVRASLVEAYNDMVDLTQQVGDDFNRQVRAFRARQ